MKAIWIDDDNRPVLGEVLRIDTYWHAGGQLRVWFRPDGWSPRKVRLRDLRQATEANLARIEHWGYFEKLVTRSRCEQLSIVNDRMSRVTEADLVMFLARGERKSALVQGA